MKKTLSSILLTGCFGLVSMLAAAAHAATPYVNTTVEGALAPGIYGRIEIGNAPPPTLIYTQPMVIQPAPVYVQQQPMYLHVPPGHAKNWAKHCARYDACHRPVYFVKVRGDDDYERRRRHDPHGVYVNKEGRKLQKEHEKKAKKYWKEQNKRHGKGHDKHDD